MALPRGFGLPLGDGCVLTYAGIRAESMAELVVPGAEAVPHANRALLLRARVSETAF
jgi:hypothetical protein